MSEMFEKTKINQQQCFPVQSERTQGKCARGKIDAMEEGEKIPLSKSRGQGQNNNKNSIE